VRSISPVSRRGWQGEQRDDFLLSELVYVLWGRRLLVAAAVLILVLLALLFGLFKEPVYTAEAVVNIKPREELSSTEERETFMEGVRGAVVTEKLLRGVMRRAGWEAGLAEFTERLEVEPTVTRNGQTGLQVRFSGSQPEQAARAANAYAELFVGRVERLNDERLAGGALPADASVERRAAPPEGSSLRLLVYAAAAAGVGLLVGGAGALLLEGRARSWRDARDAELTLRAPVLGVIPDYSYIEEG
jgi:capsular polysaccharide biosynthesis protein